MKGDAQSNRPIGQMTLNPWLQLPLTPPYVLEADSELISKHNATAREEYSYDLSLHPEPFVGSLGAPIYLLALNPGLNDADAYIHRRQDCLNVLRQAAIQSSEINHLYYLTDDFEGSPGAAWWRQKTKQLIREYGIGKTAELLCCIQYYPYHSRKFSKTAGMSSTTEYTAHIIKTGMKFRKYIIVLRSWRYWVALVPELADYDRLAMIKNPLNPCLTPKNLGGDYCIFEKTIHF